MEIATFEPRFRVPPKPEEREDHMAVCYKAGSLALLLNGGGDLAHIFWTPWSKETRDGVYNVKDRLGGIRQKDNGVVWFGNVECGGG